MANDKQELEKLGYNVWWITDSIQQAVLMQDWKAVAELTRKLKELTKEYV